jgi:Ca2+:H+ antiporter
VGIALGSATQIALFIAPVLVLLSYVIGPTPMSLQFWPGAVVMMLIAAVTAAIMTSGGRSAWFLGVLVLLVYLAFAMTLYLLPPRLQDDGAGPRKHAALGEFHAGPHDAAPERLICCASFL